MKLNELSYSNSATPKNFRKCYFTHMTKRRTTPLNNPDIQSHHCSLDVRLEKLGMVPFFQKLDHEALREVNEYFRASHFQKGEVIYYQEEAASLLRIVVFGHIKLIHHTEDGKDILTDLLQPGEYFGSLPVMGDEVYHETAYAHTTCCVLSTGHREFQSILENRPGVAVKLLEITSGRLRKSQEDLLQLSTLPVKQRLASILLQLSEKFGEDDTNGFLLQTPLSRKDLADMAGTSAETASRIMSSFQEDGLITTGRQWVAITDMNKLIKSAQG